MKNASSNRVSYYWGYTVLKWTPKIIFLEVHNGKIFFALSFSQSSAIESLLSFTET